MDFSNRDVQPQAQSTAPNTRQTATGSSSQAGKKGKKLKRGEVWRIVTVLLVLAVAILIGAVITYIVAGSDSVKDEGEYVDTSKLQVVALNNGQAYFGHIKSLNDKYLVISDVYYLQASNANASGSGSSSNTNNNVTLVKLGCEIHQPYDQMIISTDQVTFWENLQPDGKVAKAVETFQKDNPNGLKCADQGSTASSTSTSNAQNASSSPGNSNKNQ